MKTFAKAAVCLAWLAVPPTHAGLDALIVEPPEVVRAYAEAGDPMSQFNYALLCQKGEAVPLDPAQAVAWYRKAAASGFPEAEYNLAVTLEKNGAGVPKDLAEAAKWFQAAAAQGDFSAQKAMIQCYSLGLGVKKDPVKALTWDFLARRSLDLRYQLRVGLPPKPAKLRADGFAEYTTAAGAREALGPDGSVESVADDGTIVISAPDGSRTTVSKIGVRKTTFPNGTWRMEFSDGRIVKGDLNGTTETQNVDGTREVEGDGKTTAGKSVRITDKFAKDGTRTSRRVVDGDVIVEELADGGRIIETKATDDKGLRIRVIETFDKSSQLAARRLVREDGVERQGEESWWINRWLRQKDGSEIRVREKIGAGTSVESQQVMETRKPAAAVAAATGSTPETSRTAAPKDTFMAANVRPPATAEGPPPPPMMSRTYPTPIGGFAEDVMRPKPSIEQQLGDLAKLERAGRYFVGATEADYAAAQASAQRYVFNLPAVPQRPQAATWIGQRLAEMAAPPQPAPLVEMVTDRSDVYPLGLYGRQLIKKYAWKHAQTDHFIVHYLQSASAYPVMRYIECAYFVVTQTLQIDDAAGKRRSHVFVFPDATSWSDFKQSVDLPPGVEGFAYKDELLLGAPEERDTYLKVICHEATHATVARAYPGRKWPLWLNEGFAEYMSAKSLALRRGHHLERYLATDVVTPFKTQDIFDRIRYGAPGGNMVHQFYGQSERCVRTLIEKLPAQNFPRFVNLALAGNAMPVCLEQAYGPEGAKFDAYVNGH